MRTHAPFQPADLDHLDTLLARAESVVTMREIADGEDDPAVIGLRHDVDNVIEPAVNFAEWEHARGYRSTYYILHTAPYWQDETLLRSSLERMVELGHEVGIHNNALAAAYATGEMPWLILHRALEQLRDWGFDVTGTVAHGDPLCYDHHGKVRFVNDELWMDCERGTYGPAERTVDHLTIIPVPLSSYSLDYDANWLSRAAYLSDSGGRWSQPFEQVADGFPYDGQLHMLVHPDWWGEAFARERVAA